MARTTISVMKADIGSLAGHHIVPNQIIEIGRKKLEEAKESGLIKDFFVTSVGDDLELIMTHDKGENSQEIIERAKRA